MGLFSEFLNEEKSLRYSHQSNLNESFSRREENLLNEAVFSEQNLEKIMKLYGRLFSKHFESKFYYLGEENFKRATGNGVGARFINLQGYQLRFNWNKAEISRFRSKDREGKGKSFYLSSIDYWEPFNSDFARPSITVTFLQELNVVQIWDKVLKLIKRGVKGNYRLKDLVDKNAIMTEADASALDSKQRHDFMVNRAGLSKTQAYGTYSKSKFNDLLASDANLQSMYDEYVIEIEAGKPEKNDFDEDLKKTKKSFDNTYYSDPKYVFDDINAVTEFVARKGSKSFICCGLGGVGKCKSVNDTVRMADGSVKKMNEVKVGDYVLTPKGTKSQITQVYPQDNLLEMYEVTLSDGRKFICDDEQLFSTKIGKLGSDSYNGKFEIRSFKDMRQAFEAQKNELIKTGEFNRKNPKLPSVFLPYSEPIEYPKQELKLNPYLLGLLLGDGCITHEVMFSNNSKETIDWISEHLNENFKGYVIKHRSNYDYGIVQENFDATGKTRDECKNQIKEILKELNIFGANSHTKFIPTEYKISSIEDRMELIRGIVDTDGYVASGGNVSITTVSEKLADDFCEIIYSLGGRASKKIESTEYKGNIRSFFNVNFTLPRKLGNISKTNTLKCQRYQKRLEGKEFLKKLKIKDIKPVGLTEGLCFLIDDKDHLFLDGNYVVTHNTFGITKTLTDIFGPEGNDWNYHSGMKISPFTLYKTLFMERDTLVVFDEADDILKNSDIVVQLKPVLDTSGKNTMEYAFGTYPTIGMSDDEVRSYSAHVDKELAAGKMISTSPKNGIQLPSKFFFTGQLIFISNMSANKIDQSIMSRSIYIDVQLCAQDINNRIRTIMHKKYPGQSDEEINEIMEALGQSLPSSSTEPEVQYMTPEIARKLKPVTIRSMDIAMKMKQMNIPNWARLASLYV